VRSRELHCAINLGAEVIMCFSNAQAKDFYARLKQRQRQEQAGGMAKEEVALVPVIDVRKAEATKEADRERIFAKIEKTVGIDLFNARLQDFMEAALQEEARAAVLSAAAGSMHGGEGRVTLSVVHTEVKEVRTQVKNEVNEVSRQVNELKLGVSALEAKLDAVLKALKLNPAT
jgi:hypothetical protein